jgi:hypothetical protein
MKFFNILTALLFISNVVNSQELFVFTEPASNMAAKSIGLRLTNEGRLNRSFSNRTIPEVMFGLNKNLMVHLQGFLSNMDGRYQFEGGSIYGKYRLFSVDDVKRHFRIAAFGRYSYSNRASLSEDVNFEGDSRGGQAGLVFTQLLHKLALSSSLSYGMVFPAKVNESGTELLGDKTLNYSVSSGYLLLPFLYKSYNQPNFNLYFEVLGKTNPDSGHGYIDLAPSIQLILNSRARVDLGYRFELDGNMKNRYLKNMYLVRLEFNFFNVLK